MSVSTTTFAVEAEHRTTSTVSVSVSADDCIARGDAEESDGNLEAALNWYVRSRQPYPVRWIGLDWIHIQHTPLTAYISDCVPPPCITRRCVTLGQHCRYTRAALADTADFEARTSAGFILERLGRFAAAASSFDAAFQSDPTDPDLLLYSARVLAQCGMHGTAATRIDAALGMLSPPPRIDLLLLSAQALSRCGMFTAAAARIDTALGLLPQHITSGGARKTAAG